jgi:hypothetical protein
VGGCEPLLSVNLLGGWYDVPSGRPVIARRDSAAAIPASGATAGDCFAALATTGETAGVAHNQAALNQTLRVGGCELVLSVNLLGGWYDASGPKSWRIGWPTGRWHESAAADSFRQTKWSRSSNDDCTMTFRDSIMNCSAIRRQSSHVRNSSV